MREGRSWTRWMKEGREGVGRVGVVGRKCKCGRREEEIKGSGQARQGAVAAWPDPA
jgi:hypothetical protein